MPNVESKFAPGTVLGEVYELSRHVGTEGFVSVWNARDKSKDKTVAVKILEFAPMEEELALEARARFLREGRVCRLMRHGNIVPVFEIAEIDGMTYFVMEWSEGKSLEQTLREREALSVAQAVDVACKVARAMEYAHGLEIYHRDLNPRNILLLEGGDVKVTNLGFAKKLDDVTGSGILTRPGKILGNIEYLAHQGSHELTL